MMVLLWLTTGAIVVSSCTIKPQIAVKPEIAIKEEPTLKKEWFRTEDLPDVKPYQAEGKLINGETWTCFSPADSRELAVELLDSRTKIKNLNATVRFLYKQYFKESMP